MYKLCSHRAITATSLTGSTANEASPSFSYQHFVYAALHQIAMKPRCTDFPQDWRNVEVEVQSPSRRPVEDALTHGRPCPSSSGKGTVLDRVRSVQAVI